MRAKPRKNSLVQASVFDLIEEIPCDAPAPSSPESSSNDAHSAEDQYIESAVRQLASVEVGAEPQELPQIVRAIMREMGRRGGYARVPKGFGKMDPEKRKEAGKRGSAARWGKAKGEVSTASQA